MIEEILPIKATVEKNPNVTLANAIARITRYDKDGALAFIEAHESFDELMALGNAWYRRKPGWVDKFRRTDAPRKMLSALGVELELLDDARDQSRYHPAPMSLLTFLKRRILTHSGTYLLVAHAHITICTVYDMYDEPQYARAVKRGFDTVAYAATGNNPVEPIYFTSYIGDAAPRFNFSDVVNPNRAHALIHHKNFLAYKLSGDGLVPIYTPVSKTTQASIM